MDGEERQVVGGRAMPKKRNHGSRAPTAREGNALGAHNRDPIVRTSRGGRRGKAMLGAISHPPFLTVGVRVGEW